MNELIRLYQETLINILPESTSGRIAWGCAFALVTSVASGGVVMAAGAAGIPMHVENAVAITSIGTGSVALLMSAGVCLFSPGKTTTTLSEEPLGSSPAHTKSARAVG